jgi:Right handed beta helix region
LVVAALAVFGAFGSLQMILAALNVHLEPAAPVAPRFSYGIALVQAPSSPAPVALPATARPVDPDQPSASMPKVSSDKEIAVVADDDARIRILMHDAVHARQPEVIDYPGSMPTLVLPAGSGAYTAADLVRHGALVMLSSHVALLHEHVFVVSGARLNLGGPALSTLYLASGSGGFASIVGWGGSLSFTGTAARPFTIMGWDQATKSAAADQGDGRPYIREIGATMTFTYARVSSLGFWSGRTGGVAWTGATEASSTGSAVDSTFTSDTYGAFVSRGQGVTFLADRFESNELDGLHLHRYSVGSRVMSSTAVRNGGNGFLVDRATKDTLLSGDVSRHNAANGYLIDGRPLVTGASASGGSTAPSSGTMLEGSAATGNAHTSVLIEGGSGTVVKSGQFCSPTTAIALRAGVTNSVLTGNYIDCDPRSGISVGPSAPGAVIFGNIVSHPRIGVLIRGSGPINVYDNRILGATVFGVSARGATARVGGVGNVLSGTGARPVDAEADASVSALSGTDASGWSHNVKVTFVSYLEFHPLASLWLSILVLILLAAGWSYRRKLSDHPYPASIRRMYTLPAPGESSLALEPGPARPQPAAGRPPVRPVRQPAAWNATAQTADGRPQSGPRQQPTFQPAPSRLRPAPRAPAPGPRRRPEPAPSGWDRPARDAVRRPAPVTEPLPNAVARRPPVSRPVLPPAAVDRPAERKRLADTPSEGTTDNRRPMQKGVWE